MFCCCLWAFSGDFHGEVVSFVMGISALQQHTHRDERTKEKRENKIVLLFSTSSTETSVTECSLIDCEE